MIRYGSIIGVDPDKLARYRELHAAAWPEILAMITVCHIRNYSIFLRQMPDGKPCLFSYFEYHGIDFAADMAVMAADPATQRWWAECSPCQLPLADRAAGEWWAPMEEIFHHD